jgi:hypothetical protein
MKHFLAAAIVTLLPVGLQAQTAQELEKGATNPERHEGADRGDPSAAGPR